MSSIVISGDTSGAITLAAPAVSGTNTATLPAATGTVMVSGNMPAFSAYVVNQSITTNTTTKAALSTKLFDTANAFDSTTNYRFTPQVAGYYQVNANVQTAAATIAGGVVLSILYKSGSQYSSYLYEALNSNLTGIAGSGSVLVQMNGTTDYLELYLFQSTGANQSMNSYFQAILVRTA